MEFLSFVSCKMSSSWIISSAGNVMALRICNCFALSNYNPLKFSNSMPRASLVQRHTHRHPPRETPSSLYLTKRDLGVSIVAIFLNGFLPNLQKAILAQDLELQRYTDSKEGFTLLRPSSWLKVEKAGATALFEEANNGSNNIGVVVNPVRLTSLGEFGTPQFVADKLIQAERRKVKSATLECVFAIIIIIIIIVVVIIIVIFFSEVADGDL